MNESKRATEDSSVRETVAKDDSDRSAVETVEPAVEPVSEQTSATETTNDSATSAMDPSNEADVVDSTTDDAAATDYDHSRDAATDSDADADTGVPADFDLAESADRLMRLIAAESTAAPADSDDGNSDANGGDDADGQDDDAAADKEAENSAAPVGGGLAGFLQWLTQTRQLGRRASRLLEAVESLRAPLERKQRLADLVRLNLLLECNSAIGFNADGTLRNTEAAARVWTADDEEEAAAAERERADAEVAASATASAETADGKEAGAAQQQQQPRRRVVTFEDAVEGGIGGGGSGGGGGGGAYADENKLRDDAEVLMAKEEIQGEGGRHGLLVFTIVCLIGSVLCSLLVPRTYRWLADWLVLVTATTASLMLGIFVFVHAGRRRRPVEAYREMSRELQNNRILISTIRHCGG